MRQPPTGTVTVLFTDIEGSTRLWESNPDAMRRAVALHDQLLRDTIEGHDGFVFKTLGDGFCAVFDTAPDALAGALAAQRALVHAPWPDGAPLRVRMALHTGSVEERDRDYSGPPLYRVARLMAAGHGGQVLLSLATQELTRNALPFAASLRDLGARRLKDLVRPEQVFQLLHPDLPAEFPPLRSLDNPDLPNNLPQQTTSFIGREKEAAEITALLAQTRLLTLTGAGGSGKTRLSLHVAADLLDQYFDGVWFVEFAPLNDPAQVPQAVAAALAIRDRPGQAIAKTLCDDLKEKRLLLVLDNCEHLIAACAALAAELLRNCPGVQLLGSSREPLGVPGEQTYRVPSLTLPDPKSLPTVEVLSQYEAVRLFIERARSVQREFVVSNGNAPSVAQVCWRLDGIPLAIELAAARVRTLTVDEVNARLDNRFRLLTGGARTLLPRQQTLRALMDWSYDLLSDPEKTLLARLSVFAGGWTLSAMEAVCGDEDPGEDLLDLLTALVDKSLVVTDAVEDSTRYRLLETVRHYAFERLRERGEFDRVGVRHAAWCLALSEQAEPHLRGSEQETWLARLEREHDNLRAALTWEERAGNTESSLRLGAALWRFWMVRGYWSEGRGRLEAALAVTTDDDPETLACGRALHGLGVILLFQGEHGAARDALNRSLTICRMVGDRQGEGGDLLNLGNIAYSQGNYGAARTDYEQALTVFQALGDQRGETRCFNNLGSVAFSQGDYPAARRDYEQALAICRAAGDQEGEALDLNNLGNVACAQGDYRAAQIYAEQSLAIYRATGDRQGEADGLVNLGEVALAQGEYDAAQEYTSHALAIFRAVGDRRGEGICLSDLGATMWARGDAVRAQAYDEQSLTVSRSVGDRVGEARSLARLGLSAASRGERGAARGLLEQALAICRDLGNLRVMSETLAHLATTARLEESLAEAWKFAAQSLALNRQIGDPRLIADALEEYAALALAEERHEDAVRLAGAAASARTAVSVPLTAWQSETRVRVIAAAHAVLSGETFAAAWDAGQAMSPDQAMDEMMEAPSPPILGESDLSSLHDLTPPVGALLAAPETSGTGGGEGSDAIGSAPP